MDFDALAHETILEILRHSPVMRFKKTNEFSQGEVKMLEYLYIFQDGITAGELSDKINISTARVATILNGLEKKHLIRRCADDQDKRKIVVYLTEGGRKTGQEKYEMMLRHMSRLFSALGERDTLELLRLFRRILSITDELEREG
jgi:DNA-binding MarR family transcriptional regulator